MNSPEKPEKISIVWPIIFSACMLGVVSALYIPAAAGKRLDPMSGLHSMISGSLFFWSVWRPQQKGGWHGGLIGAVAGLLLWMLAVFISEYVRTSGE